ncbi:MAG TPA: DsrE/DsrF/DrsH-like family protein [Candidatus Limnocylindrales bacterium]|nr:DsrE/DsrF/DrsH-like family protein [Candidatus Limnocylindrales bacterium]
MNDTLSIVLFSGTADKLHAAATLAAGAAALDRPVNILLQYWALDAFRTARIEESKGLAWDAMTDGTSRPVHGTKAIAWLETFRMAKELGSMTINACSGSLDVLGIAPSDLDPIVDEPGGIATFLMAAEGGQLVFI